MCTHNGFSVSTPQRAHCFVVIAGSTGTTWQPFLSPCRLRAWIVSSHGIAAMLRLFLSPCIIKSQTLRRRQCRTCVHTNVLVSHDNSHDDFLGARACRCPAEFRLTESYCFLESERFRLSMRSRCFSSFVRTCGSRNRE